MINLKNSFGDLVTHYRIMFSMIVLKIKDLHNKE